MCFQTGFEMMENIYPCTPKIHLTGEEELISAPPKQGMDFSMPSEFWWVMDILSSSNFPLGVDHSKLPCGQGRIDSVPADDERI